MNALAKSYFNKILGAVVEQPQILLFVLCVFFVREVFADKNLSAYGISTTVNANPPSSQMPEDHTQPYVIGSSSIMFQILDNVLQDSTIGWNLGFFSTVNNYANSVSASPILTNYNIGGKNFSVFPSDHPNLGIAFSLQDGKGSEIPITGITPQVILSGSGNGVTNVDTTFRVHLVYIPNRTALSGFTLTPNSNNTLTGNVRVGNGQFTKYDIGGNPKPEKVTYDLYVNYTVLLKPRTCALASNSSPTVFLQTVTKSNLDENTLIVGDNSAMFSFDCPEDYSSIILQGRLSDANNPSNTTNILSTETGAGNAQGVGIQLLLNGGAVVKLGPLTNDPTTDIGSIWPIGSVGSVTRNVSLKPQYIKTGPIVPGEVKARAIVTFYYQ